MNIGVCGTGKMGSALGERLIELGHAVTVWNRTAARTTTLAQKGAQVAASPAALAAACDTIIVMVLDDAAQTAVYTAAQGLLDAALKGRLVIDMSTVTPTASQSIAARVTAAGADFVECPVGGTVTPARTGKLLGMAGGEAAAYVRAKPLLESLTRRVDHVGPAGSGAAMKLAINLPLAVYWEALGEALSIAVSNGVAPQLAADILGDSSGAIAVAKPRIPMVLDAIDGTQAAGPAFDLSSMAKDLGLMQAAAQAQGFAVPVVDAARASFQQAMDAGWGGRDAVTQAAWRFLANTRKP